METVKVEIPKRKPNHFFVFDIKNNKYNEIKYISQTELAQGFRQVLPRFSITKKKESNNNKRKYLINHFSVTLCFLPEYLWKRLKYDGESYKTINDGNTLYSIVETNQDELMNNLFNEMKKYSPDRIVIEHLVNELDESQHTSWLIIRSNQYLKTGIKYEPEYIKNI